MAEEKAINDNNMSICLIDNYQINFPTDRIESLTKIVQDNFRNIDLNTIHYSQLDPDQFQDFSGFILSGSNLNVSEFDSNTELKEGFSEELKLIRKTGQKPILGICFGHQLITHAFNGRVHRMGRPNKGSKIINISIKKVDEVAYYNEFLVNIQHQDYVLPEDSEIREKFDIIAVQEVNGYNTIQYMRHFNRPIFSVQFHPETHLKNSKFTVNCSKEEINKTKSYGEEVIKNFISLCL